jgi:aryl-phospho-beta-D-glucosidase BglC (GH1 family)
MKRLLILISKPLRLRKPSRRWLLFSISTILVFILSFSCSKSASNQLNGVNSTVITAGIPQERLFHLDKGVNVTGWFTQTALNAKSFSSKFTDSDVHLIKSMGFRHVRLPIDPDILFNENDPSVLNFDNVQYIDRAIDMITAQGLAVIVDIHPKNEFKQSIFSDQDVFNNFARFWKSFAKHLSSRDPKLVFLEGLNEPAVDSPERWNSLQQQLIQSMRSGAPNHTLIASANLRTEKGWDQIGGVEALRPVSDQNVVYNFHFYQPKIFASQGARWTWKAVLPFVKNVPYPSSPEAVAPLVSSVSNDFVRKQLMLYGKQRWNYQKLESMINRAAEWGRLNNVPLTCNEFGVYRVGAPVKDRNVWLKDVRSLLEKNQIGWSLWNYEGGFGVTINTGGNNRPDNETVDALFK